MKPLNIIVAVLFSIFVVGCETARVILRPAQTNDVALRVTNSVPQLTQTEVVRTELNPVPGGPELRITNTVTLTNLVLRVETNVIRVIIPEVAYTNVSLSPVLTTGVQVAGELAPVPWAGAASGIFGVLSGGIIAWINNSRRKKALDEAYTWEETAGVLVDNVEAVRKEALKLPGYTKELDAKVVRGLEVAQRVAGVKDRVHTLVEERTDDTVPLT
jgi:hypothetical protein